MCFSVICIIRLKLLPTPAFLYSSFAVIFCTLHSVNTFTVKECSIKMVVLMDLNFALECYRYQLLRRIWKYFYSFILTSEN